MPQMQDASRVRRFVNDLMKWMPGNLRKLPWRYESNPFCLLVALVLLQRTRAEQVLKVYPSIMDRYGSPDRMASADPGELESLLRPLGLTGRARRLISAARIIVEKHGGRVPLSREELLKLPGVGEYIADAFLCIYAGARVAMVDANVIRVLQRLTGLRLDVKSAKELLLPLLPDNCRGFNLALIDFAALVCKPRKPLCYSCFASSYCHFFQLKQRLDVVKIEK